MIQPVFNKSEDFFVSVGVISIKPTVDLKNLTVDYSTTYKATIEKCLSNVKECDFIIFPEYSFTPLLSKTYQDFSDENGVIIIGGSCAEETTDGFFAYCPIFSPRRDSIKIYKRHLTHDERLYGSGKLQEYKEPVTNFFECVIREKQVRYAVYICLDFLRDVDFSQETNLCFVPQYEKSPGMFISDAYKLSSSQSNYVLGCNVAEKDYRTIGTGICNETIVSALYNLGYRPKNYIINKVEKAHYNKSILYDTQNEKIIKLRLNLSKPMPSQGYSLIFENPNVIPLDLISI